MIERRRFKRTNVEVLENLVPKVYFPNDPTPYSVINFSFTGLFIENQTNYRKGEVLHIELEIPAIGRIPMSVEVVHVVTSEQKGIGVEIFEIPEQFKKIWAHYIKACHILLTAKEEYQRLQLQSKK